MGREREFVTARVVAKQLNVSEQSIRRWTGQGLPVHRIGGRLVRFEIPAVMAWLAKRGRNHDRAA
jgi:excisionase family DNA binding protein